MIRDLATEVRRAARGLLRHRGFTALAVLTLGLGIGTMTAAFGVIDHVLLLPLPYGDPGRIAMIWSSWTGFRKTWVSWDELEAYRGELHSLAGVAASSRRRRPTSAAAARPSASRSLRRPRTSSPSSASHRASAAPSPLRRIAPAAHRSPSSPTRSGNGASPPTRR